MSDFTPLYTALKNKGGFSVVEETFTGKQLNVLARVPPAKKAAWLALVERLKNKELDADWTLDISMVFFPKNNQKGGKLVYAWRLLLKSSDFDAAVEELKSVAAGAPNHSVEVEEIPLPGGGAHRNATNANGKGARPTSGSGASGPSLNLIRR